MPTVTRFALLPHRLHRPTAQQLTARVAQREVAPAAALRRHRAPRVEGVVAADQEPIDHLGLRLSA